MRIMAERLLLAEGLQQRSEQLEGGIMLLGMAQDGCLQSEGFDIVSVHPARRQEGEFELDSPIGVLASCH